MENQSIRREKTKPLFFSARSREMIIERIRSGEFKTHREVMETFGVGYSTVTYWKKKAGFKFPGRWREIEDVLPNEKAEEMKQKPLFVSKHLRIRPSPPRLRQGIRPLLPEACLKTFRLQHAPEPWKISR